MSWLERVTPAEVVDARTFCRFAQQELGTPYPSGGQIAAVSKQAKWFFEHNPTATWQTFCRVVAWAKAKRKRPGKPETLMAWARWAWADGYLPELDPGAGEQIVEDGIIEALQVETDPEWRRRLIVCQGRESRRRVLEEWKEMRARQRA